MQFINNKHKCFSWHTFNLPWAKLLCGGKKKKFYLKEFFFFLFISLKSPSTIPVSIEAGLFTLKDKRTSFPRRPLLLLIPQSFWVGLLAPDPRSTPSSPLLRHACSLFSSFSTGSGSSSGVLSQLLNSSPCPWQPRVCCNDSGLPPKLYF